jgi:hypothetical protein
MNELTLEELDHERAEMLPDREVMGFCGPIVVVKVNIVAIAIIKL